MLASDLLSDTGDSMKNLSLGSLLLLVLAGCAAPLEPGEGVQKEEQAIKAPLVGCPTFDGEYTRPETAEDGSIKNVSVNVNTKIEAGVTSYSFDKGVTYRKADGEIRKIDEANANSGTLRLSCEAQVLTIEISVPTADRTDISRYSAPSENELMLEEMGDDGQVVSITYKKKVENKGPAGH